MDTRKFATNSLARNEAISFVKYVNGCSIENATHYVDDVVSEARRICVDQARTQKQLFLVHDDINGWDYYIDTSYYMFTN